MSTIPSERERTPSAASSAEAELVSRLRAGDPAAFEQIVRVNSPRLLAVATRYLPNHADAADAVQDAFVSAWKAVSRFEGGSSVSTWLHRIVVNACLMKLRSARRKPERSIEDLLPKFKDDGHAWEPAAPWNPDPGSGITAEETRKLIRDKIDELPEGYRLVLMLRDIEGLDTDETARLLESTPNAVKVRLHRARQALRHLLDPHLRGGRP